jgi:hypothetical protein
MPVPLHTTTRAFLLKVATLDVGIRRCRHDFMALFWVGVVVLVVWGIRSTGDVQVHQDSSKRAIEILEERRVDLER